MHAKIVNLSLAAVGWTNSLKVLNLCYSSLKNMYFLDKISAIYHMILLAQGVFINPNLPVDDYAELGDLNLAFMAPLYLSSSESQCRAEFYPSTVQDGQAARWAVNKVNTDPHILPNISLGIILMNDCARESVILARATQLLPRTSCYSSTSCEKRKRSVQPPWPPDEGLPAYDNVIGIIGPPVSGRSILTACLFAAYELPQISYAATSDVLSDKATYPYFSRVIPPDRFQASAMVSLLVHYNWTYISTLNLGESYGRDGIQHVVTNAKKHGICVAYSGEFHNEADDEVYDGLVRNLADHPKARVVILFMHEDHIRKLFLALERKDHVYKYIFIAPDSFISFAYKGIEHLFLGTFAIQPKYSVLEEYNRYFESLPFWRNESINYWEGLYTEKDLSCTWDSSNNSSKKCSEFGKVGAMNDFFWSELAPGVIDSVLTFSHALHALISYKCPNVFNDKALLYKCINGRDYLNYVRNASFDGVAQHIQFDQNGDILGGYDITLFKKRPDGSLGNVVIGDWSRITETVSLDETLVEWYLQNEAYKTPQSVCAKPCAVGEFYLQGEKVCCWQCRKCRDYERVRDDLQGCETCPELTWPDQDNFTTCDPIPPTYMGWTDSLAIGLEALGGCGIVTTLTVALIFIIYRNKRVIKGSGRELMAPITFGIFVAFLTVFAYLTKPSSWSCYCNYFGFHLSCTFIFGPLFLKTLRLYRIFAAAERCETRVTMVSANSQVGCATIIFLVQVGITVGVVIVEPAHPLLQMPIRSFKYTELLCNLPLQNLLIPLSFNLLLLIMCAVFGFLTRKLPDNFNESWYIFISVATTIFIWVAFLPTYIMAFYAYHKAALLSLVLILNSTVTVFCLYTPKIYAVFFVEDSKIKVTNFEASTFDSDQKSTVTSSTTM